MDEKETKMTFDEAEEIVCKYEDWEDASCSCHINPPCSKCVEQPSEEDYLEALKIVNKGWAMDEKRTCNQCSETLNEYFHEIMTYECRFFVCINPKCANYSLLQIPLEMMPNEEK